MEVKVSLSMLVPGAGLLTPEFCEKNPKESYDKHKIPFTYTKGKGKNTKRVKELLVISTRKQRTVTQNINICEEAYEYMLTTPTSNKLAKVWNSLSKKERLKAHFDLIAHDLHAISYSYEVLGD